MEIRILLIILVICIPVSSDGTGTGDGSSDLATNVSPPEQYQAGNETESGEALMNLAFRAREYALENGKLAAVSAFSDRATFFGDGMYVIAGGMDGVILADPIQSVTVGTCAFSHDHDTGIIGRLCDCAGSGGGLFISKSGNDTVTWYVCPVDVTWWVAAVAGNLSPVYTIA